MAGTLTGGKRDRMILESILRGVESDLTTRGWFGAGRGHDPLKIIDAFPSETEEVAVNTIAFSFGDSFSDPLEMGSMAEEHYYDVFVDFFSESDALGRHVIGDVYEYIQKSRYLDIYDYDQVTPAVDFQVYVEPGTVEKRLPARATNPWQKHWHILSFRVMDDRSNA